MDRKYSDLPCTMSGLSVVSGGKRLTLLPPFALSSSCLASSRLWSAKASRGESSGGCSPATCRRGDLRGRWTEACDSGRRSIWVGLVGVAMMSCSSHWQSSPTSTTSSLLSLLFLSDFSRRESWGMGLDGAGAKMTSTVWRSGTGMHEGSSRGCGVEQAPGRLEGSSPVGEELGVQIA